MHPLNQTFDEPQAKPVHQDKTDGSHKLIFFNSFQCNRIKAIELTSVGVILGDVEIALLAALPVDRPLEQPLDALRLLLRQPEPLLHRRRVRPGSLLLLPLLALGRRRPAFRLGRGGGGGGQLVELDRRQNRLELCR